jgi:hypothetical protein
MNTTRRSFLSRLLSFLPATFLLGGIKREHDAEAEALKKYYEPERPRIIEMKYRQPGITSSAEIYIETKTGYLVDGKSIRLFLDWTPLTPERPRYARIIYRPIKSGYRGMVRGRAWQLITYLDSELHPYDESFDMDEGGGYVDEKGDYVDRRMSTYQETILEDVNKQFTNNFILGKRNPEKL